MAKLPGNDHIELRRMKCSRPQKLARLIARASHQHYILPHLARQDFEVGQPSTKLTNGLGWTILLTGACKVTPSSEVLEKRNSPIETAAFITPDLSFLDEVEEFGGERISLCYQCKKCSSGCPVTFAMDYLPHVILRMVQLGLKDRVLSSTTIWICASCETCTTRCPNEIDIAGVMDALRRMALARASPVAPAVRDVPKFHLAFLNSIKAGGRVHEVSMLAGYMLKTNFWAKLRSEGLLRLGWEMFRHGKLKLLPHRVHRRGEIKELFKRAGK